MLNENDIHAEYPADVDDENVSEQGFQSTLPGESTRVSNALALFRMARILSKVLDENYPAAFSHDLSIQKISALSDELDIWLRNLPTHLHLQFVQDKPSTHVIGSRSPLLVRCSLPCYYIANQQSQSLGYHYVRTLIHRPAVGSSLGNKASSSVVTLAQSSKHIVQIIQLLDERRMSFSFCLNRNDVLLLAGFGLLFQGLDLDRKGKLIQDSQRLLCSVIEILERNGALGATEFKKVACAMISIDHFSNSARISDDSTPRRKSQDTMPAPQSSSKPGRKLQNLASRCSPNNVPVVKLENGGGRRSTVPTLPAGDPLYARSNSQNSISSAVSDSLITQYSKRVGTSQSPFQSESMKPPNLDYLSFINDSTPVSQHMSVDPARTAKTCDQSLYGNSGLSQEGQTSMDHIFPSADIFTSYISPSPSTNVDWCSDLWNLTPDFSQQQPQSRISFSEEELTSGEEMSNCELSGDFQGMTLPATDGLGGLEGLDTNFGI